MSIKTLINSTILAAALTLSVPQAHAETSFSTLAGIEAETMNAAEMEATQGRFLVDPISGNLADLFGNVFAPDPEAGTYSDKDGNVYKLALFGREGAPEDIGLRFLMAQTPQDNVAGFNMFGTKALTDGSLVDVFGRNVGSWSGPGS